MIGNIEISFETSQLFSWNDLLYIPRFIFIYISVMKETQYNKYISQCHFEQRHFIGIPNSILKK